jgi:hypothetical protein
LLSPQGDLAFELKRRKKGKDKRLLQDSVGRRFALTLFGSPERLWFREHEHRS